MSINVDRERLIEIINTRCNPHFRCMGILDAEEGLFVVLETAEPFDLTDENTLLEKLDELENWTNDFLNWFLQDFIVIFNEMHGVQYKIEDASDEYTVRMKGDEELAEDDEDDRIVFRIYNDSDRESESTDNEIMREQSSNTCAEEARNESIQERVVASNTDNQSVEPKYYNMAKGMLADMVPDGNFDRTRSYAAIHVEIPGVSSLLKQIDDNKQKYHEAKSVFIENNTETLAMSLQKVAELESRKGTMSLVWKIAIVYVVATIVFAVAMPSFFLTRIIVLLLPLALLAIPVGFIGDKVFSRKARDARKEQENFLESIKGKMDWDIARYTSKDNGLFGQVDDRYLASLDPAQREVVFMRRDQERQHQEALKAQQEHQAVIEEEQRRMRESQEESTRMTKRILDIEEERERERRQNRYW